MDSGPPRRLCITLVLSSWCPWQDKLKFFWKSNCVYESFVCLMLELRMQRRRLGRITPGTAGKIGSPCSFQFRRSGHSAPLAWTSPAICPGTGVGALPGDATRSPCRRDSKRTDNDPRFVLLSARKARIQLPTRPSHHPARRVRASCSVLGSCVGTPSGWLLASGSG
jgi:hypothetical protein